MKTFYIVTKDENGAPVTQRMKDWLRKHQELIPGGVYRHGLTSRQWLGFLKKNGWQVNESDDAIRITPVNCGPTVTGVIVAEEMLGEIDDGEEIDFEFALESHLRDFLAKNLATLPIKDRRLRLYSDKSGKNGIEYATEVGFIDILAQDQNNEFYVFELKLSRGPDRAMGQILRYMGWIKKNLAGESIVHGILVAKDIEEKLRFAAVTVPNVALLEYEIDFKLKPTTV